MWRAYVISRARDGPLIWDSDTVNWRQTASKTASGESSRLDVGESGYSALSAAPGERAFLERSANAVARFSAPSKSRTVS